MLNWVLVLVAPFLVLLLIEELSHYIWRIYLREPSEKKETRLRQFLKNTKQAMNKYRKNPSH